MEQDFFNTNDSRDESSVTPDDQFLHQPIVQKRLRQVIADRRAGIEPVPLDPEFYEKRRAELEQKIRERDETTE